MSKTLQDYYNDFINAEWKDSIVALNVLKKNKENTTVFVYDFLGHKFNLYHIEGENWNVYTDEPYPYMNNLRVWDKSSNFNYKKVVICTP